LASFQAMVADYQQQVEQARQQQVYADRERWWLKSALLHELAVSGRTAKGAISKKARTKVQKAWPEGGSDDLLEMTMDKACEDFLAGMAPGASEDDAVDLPAQARMLCIRLEFVAGLQSPHEDRNQRMQYQVDRLAESMSGESARLPALAEARDAEKTWLGMYALPESEFKTFGKRVKQALTAIMETH
jgi:DNA repair protein SbcC/Rad50